MAPGRTGVFCNKCMIKKSEIMKTIIYFLTTIIATSAGGVSGMGGGIIIKPVLDFMGDFTPQIISVMSATTVFVMSLVSTWRNIRNGIEIKKDVAVTVALGAVAGGLAGQKVFSIIAGLARDSAFIVRVQNVLLLMVVAAILLYMKNKERIRSRELSGTAPVFASGLALGMVASFLGIGGGPMNVAIFIYLFSYSSRSAAACSLITVLFSQLSKLTLAAAGGDFAGVDWTLLIPMLIAGVAGGFISGAISRRITDRGVDIVFNTIQVCVLGMCVINIITA